MGVMKKEDLRIVFMGTPEFAVATLDKLIAEQFNVVAVVTQPDKPVGRHGSVLQPSPVKAYACSKDISCFTTSKNERRSFSRGIAFRIMPIFKWL